jgi:release factor glutamine methyltransferase
MRIALALTEARSRGVARLDAQLLLAHLLQRPRTWLLAHDDAALDARQSAAWQTLLARRAAGEPLAYLVGEREFHGLMLQVGPAVLIPRPETELLVEWALERLPHAPAQSLIDLGTGSGALALALKQAWPQADIWATDASPAALSVARANARRHGLELSFAEGDWWAAVGNRRFGLAVSNPPYVAGDDPHLSALAHEPRAALTPGGDGLQALRQLIAAAPTHLLPGAWLLLEHGHDQAAAVRGLFDARGFGPAATRQDLAALPRCTGAMWPEDNPQSGRARNPPARAISPARGAA